MKFHPPPMTTSQPNNSQLPQTKKAVLAIAGFDPTGGAGITIDAAVFRALGLHPLTVLTSAAAQGANSVRQVISLPESFIRDELEIIIDEFQPAAVKVGMLFSIEAIKVVSKLLKEQKIPTVLDPVIVASSGGNLIEKEALSFFQEELVPQCTIITPNIPEAAHFLGRNVLEVDEMETGALELASRWGCAVLLKGGHLKIDPVDVLADRGRCTVFTHTRVNTSDRLRGTGCMLSSALAGFLAKNYDLEKAVAAAIDFTVSRIQNRYQTGLITGVMFPDPTCNL